MERRQVLPVVDAVADAREDIPRGDVRRAPRTAGDLGHAHNGLGHASHTPTPAYGTQYSTADISDIPNNGYEYPQTASAYLRIRIRKISLYALNNRCLVV